MKILRKLEALLRRKQLDADMAEELRGHIELQTQANLAAGMTPDEARYAARRQFGGQEQIKEMVREQRSGAWFDQMSRDFGNALRSLAKSPGFTTVSLLTLALGIGACTAVFSIVDAVILRPLAYPAAQQLVAARIRIPAYAKTYPTLPVGARFYQEWRDCPAFAELALIDRGDSTLTGSGEPVRLSSVRASANLFATLRVTPALGRSFAADEDKAGKSAVVMLSDRLWRRQFSADPAVIGRSITLNESPVTVIGVLPPDFRLPEAVQFVSGRSTSASAEPEIFFPKVLGTAELNDIFGRFNYEVIGRLARGATLAEATAQMDVVAARLARLSGSGQEAHGLLVPLQEAVTGAARRGLFVLLGAVIAVLLIACLNLSMLALARAERRSHDLAVRSALGASRFRLVREALAESLLLSAGGGALGCLCALGGLGVLLRFAPRDIPRLDEVHLDSSVLLFGLAATFAASLLAGLIPAWRAAHADAKAALRNSASRTTTSGVGARRLRHLFVAIQAGVSTVLLAAAALLGASFLRLVNVDVGFRAPDVLTTELAVPSARYRSDADRNALLQRLLATVAATPGITSAAISTALPLQGETWVDGVWTPGDPRPEAERIQTNIRFISPDFFAVLGIPLVAGSTFNDSDRDRKTAILSRGLAAQLWPGQDPIGRKVLRRDGEALEVIGVVGDVRANVDQRPVPVMYWPYWVWPQSEAALVVRTPAPAGVMVPLLRDAIHRADAEIPVGGFRTMNDLLQVSVAQRRFQLRLVAAFALSALTLVGLGLYGVISHSVTQRTRELGIRLAFGAAATDIHRLVLRQALTPVVTGLLAGCLGALAGGRLLASLLYETEARNPAALAGVAGVLALVAALACWLPARRATKVDPMVALRAE
jgi:predicted permease